MDPGSIGKIRSEGAARHRLRRRAATALLLCVAAIAPLRAQTLPGLSIGDVYLAEGEAATTAFEFRVALDAPAPVGGVRFDIATADGSAVGGSDYVASATTLQIPEGATGIVHTVLVHGDNDYEPDETFLVGISNAAGAGIVDGQAVGTILNDEPTPRLLVADRSVFEGDAGDTTVRIEVALDIPTTVEVRVDYETREGSANADEDYATATGTLVFAPGETLRHIDLAIRGDTLDERSESFELYLRSALDGMGDRSAQIIIVTDDDGSYNIQPSTLPDGTLGVRYDRGFSLDGRPDARFAITAGALPPGIEMILSPYNGRNYLVGDPVTMGTYSFEVTAFADASLEYPLARRSYTIVIGGQPLILPPTAFPTAAFDEPYDAALDPATGALPPYRYALTGGALPPGLALSESGRITGEPSGSGTFAFTVTVSDSSPTGPFTASREYTLQALPPVLAIEPPFHPLDGTEGQGYSVQFGIRGIGTPPYTLAVAAGALPPGLELTATGEVVGVPAASGDFTFTLSVTDSTVSVPATASAAFTIRIAPSPLSFGPPTLPDASTDAVYEQRFVATGANQWQLFQLSDGALPPGLDLYDDTLAGTPTEAGTYAFAITVTDALANAYTRRYTLVVTSPPLVVDPVALQAATAGRPFSHQLRARGGVRPYRFELAGGALPPGLSMNADGFIDGTPTTSGSFHARIAATDSAGSPAIARQDVNIAVELPRVTIFTDRLQPAAVGANYVSTLTAYGGRPPYTFSLVDGVLPAGLELRPEGYLLGVPQQAGSFVVAIAATDSSAPFGPIVGSREFTLVVEPPRLGFAPGVLPTAYEGVAYTARVVATNGIAPYRFELTAGALPPGLQLSTDGIISGIPGHGNGGAYGYHVFTLGATDATGRTAMLRYEIAVMLRSMSIGPDAVPAGTAGMPYEVRFVANHAASPVVFTWEEGSLPRGLRFDPETATLSGVPLETGSFLFRLRATDAAQAFATRGYTLQIAAPTLTLTPGVLADGRVGTAYTATFTAGGGIAPYRFSLSENGGPLPPGLQLTLDGRIEGTPTAVGSYAFAIVALDSTAPAAATLERAYTLTIASADTADAAPPDAIARSVDAFAGTTTVVDLTEGARGGPFTAATLLSLTPADAGTARIDSVDGRHRLTFVAAPDFAGRVEATFTLANAAATSAPTRIVFVVAQRPDPARDPRIARLLDAQTRTARRFADAQIGNFRQRLESLHDGRAATGFHNALRAQHAFRCEPAVGALPGRPCVRPAMPRPSVAASATDARDLRPPLGVWAAGTVRSANHDGRNAATGSAFETDGVSVGADYRVDERIAVGLGLGYGRDGGTLGGIAATASEASRGDGEATTVAVYASLRPGARAFVDLLYGEQTLVFALHRDAGVSGRRDGAQRFASIAAGAEFARGDWRIAPYARIDTARARFSAYTESGDAARALTYGALRSHHLAANAGLRLDFDRETSRGTFAPQLRLEYRRDLDGAGAQRLRYADAAVDTEADDASSGFARDRLRLELDLRFDTRRDWSFGFETRFDADSDGRREAGAELRVEKRF